MSYSILHSFWDLLAPSSLKTHKENPKCVKYEDYDEIIAINEANEVVVLHIPKKYSLSYL